MVGLGRFRPKGFLGTSTNTFGAHQPRDSIGRAGEAPGVEFGGHSRTSINPFVAMSVDTFDLGFQTSVLGGPWAGCRPSVPPGIKAAAGETEGLTKLANTVLGPHHFNQRIPNCGSSPSMLMAFFRISR